MNMIHEELAALQSIELDGGQGFSGKKSDTAVKGYAAPSDYTPVIAIGGYGDDVEVRGCFWANLFDVEAVRYIRFSETA